MKKNRSAFLGILGLLIVLVLAAGCYRPAAPDVTGTPAGDAEASPPGTPDVEATARANATEAAQTTAAQTPEPSEQEEPTETPTEEPATATPLPTATTEPTTVAPTTEPTATPCPAGPTTYTVQPDDNLFRIALRFNTTVEAIAEANGIANPRLIQVGQTLTVPAAGGQQPPAGGTTYVVQPGDNLFRIALRYNMSHQRLAEYNGITNPSNIFVGQVIQIPSQ